MAARALVVQEPAEPLGLEEPPMGCCLQEGKDADRGQSVARYSRIRIPFGHLQGQLQLCIDPGLALTAI